MSEDWYTEPYAELTRFGLRVTERIFEGRSDYQHVEVVDTAAFGRVLIIDGVFMTSERDELLYHEMLVHPTLVTAPRIERVLIIGGGDGGTARQVLRHPQVKHCHMVEIDPVVVDACKQHLPAVGGGAWKDPRFLLTIGDGIGYVKESSDPPYDVVLLDGTDPRGPGEGLFDRDFYRGVHRVLGPDGVLALQSESPLLMDGIFYEIQDALQEVFTTVRPYFGPVPLYSAGIWSWTHASNTTGTLPIIPERADAVEAQCQVWNRDLHVASFTQPNYVRKRLLT